MMALHIAAVASGGDIPLNRDLNPPAVTDDDEVFPPLPLFVEDVCRRTLIVSNGSE